MTHYLLICAACDPGGQLPIPFENPESREVYRAVHARVVGPDGTPHNAFTLYDQPTDPHHWGTAHDQYLETKAGGES